MKIRCRCGHILVDQTDYIPYKAHLIPDQDLFDLQDKLDALIQQAREQADSDAQEQPLSELYWSVQLAFNQYTNQLYQCTNCGRLYLRDGSDSLYVFAPEHNASPVSLLRSVLGEQWKRPLRGRWNSQAGHGQIDGSQVKEDFLQFEDWDELEAQYFVIFNRLRQRGLLRDALLKKDGKVVHQWAPQ